MKKPIFIFQDGQYQGQCITKVFDIKYLTEFLKRNLQPEVRKSILRQIDKIHKMNVPQISSNDFLYYN